MSENNKNDIPYGSDAWIDYVKRNDPDAFEAFMLNGGVYISKGETINGGSGNPYNSNNNVVGNPENPNDFGVPIQGLDENPDGDDVMGG